MSLHTCHIMEQMTLHTYLPQDRLRALARRGKMPDRTYGSALFADISGFTPLTESLGDSLGARRGAEEMTKHLSRVYNALIAEVESFGGSVIDFAGDAIMCWFDGAHGSTEVRAVSCALSLQQVMVAFKPISLPNGKSITMAVKVAVTSGPARRFIVGDPAVNYIDVLAGETIARTSLGEKLSHKGDVLVDKATADALGNALTISEWRASPEPDSVPFAVVRGFKTQGLSLTPLERAGLPSDEELKTWIHRSVYERERAGQGSLMTEFRPCLALFVRFSGIDYDSDEAGDQLNNLIRSMQARVVEFGGALLQITVGDKGSYAYINFGALGMHEDGPRRAVKLALSLRESLGSDGFKPSLQIGITQGTMFVGPYGSESRKTFGALGDDVNLCARLMTTAAPGEILVSGRVRKALPDEFVYEAHAPMNVKGKTEPLSVYSILSVKQQRAVRLQEPAYALPMIGRKKELGLVSEKLSLSIQGKGQIVGVTGAAGMGKSRLIAEGIRLARRGKLTGYGGACKSDGVDTPYLVWSGIWNAFFDLDPAMPLRKQIRSIERELEDQAPENLDALPLLGSVLGLPLTENEYTRALQPKDRKSQLEALLLHCLEYSAREASGTGGGLLLVLEDLHWIDPVSSNLLDLISRAVENLPILILLSYRLPEIDALDPGVSNLRALAHFTEVRLTDLTEAESEQVIRGKLQQLFPEQRGGIPHSLIERVTARAQGNPFYAEELLNFLRDSGFDPHNEEALARLELPGSLQSLILSRIDRLTPAQQLAFRVASIIGRSFRLEDLLKYYPWQGLSQNITSDLQELVKADLLLPDPSEPESVYIFKHLLTHEVSYENIAYATRVQLHGMYAEYLERTHPERMEQIAASLAHHYDRAQIPEKAAYYLTKAGDQAAANYANEEALSYFNRALKNLTGEATRAHFDILWKRERIYDLLGKRLEQRQDLETLSRLVDSFEDAPNLRAGLFIRKARLEIDTGDFAAAKTNAQTAIRESSADGEGSADLIVDALLLEARAMFLAGQAVAAKPQLEDALKRSREHRYLRGEYNALASLGLWNWYNGDNKSAVELMEQSLALIRQAGDIRRESDILNNLGIVSKDMSKFDEALAYYEAAQKIARKIGDRSGEASLLANMGRACLVARDYIQSETYSVQAAQLAAEVNEPAVRGIALHNRSEALRLLGRYAEAKESAEEALKMALASGYKTGEADTLENIAMIEFAQEDHERAMGHAEAALAIAREISSRRVETSVLTRIGMFRLEMGQLDAAQNALSEAEEIGRELNEPIPMFEIQAGLAQVALARGGPDSPERAMARIQALADEILQDPPTQQSLILPMGLYLASIRILLARNDPRVEKIIARANWLMKSRSDRIPDSALRASYLNIPEHCAIAEFAGGFNS